MSADIFTEIATLQDLLTRQWESVADATEKHPREGFVTVAQIEGDSGRWTQTMRVITRGPSKQHYAWEYKSGLTESQEAIGPAEYGTPEVTPVRRQAKRVTVTEWVAE
ncbi:hypothetical protein [Nocardia gipuzkoensis]